MAIPKTEVLITVAGMESGRLVVEPGEYLIGRNPECRIKVEADLVSRLHAKLTLNFDNAFIEDLGSSHGTQVNGKPVAGNTRLWPNQKIQVGAATIELRRIKVESTPDMTVTPIGEVLRRVLPEEFLREKKYDIGDIVAKGGMGAILRAKEATTDRTVAMKVMLDTNDADALTRFLNEARITAQLEHPNIVPVHELSLDENGQVFYTMKMVKGITLKKVLELLAEGIEGTVTKYPPPALLTIFQKVSDAIAFAHSKGVIHRDLKPENIMLADYGEVLVMDWGLAKLTRNAEGGARKKEAVAAAELSAIRAPGSEFGSMTLAGSVMGTPTFMSPEQARGEVDAHDARSDIFALGAILYQILSLRLPVTGKDAWEIVAKVGRGEIEPLTNPKSAIRNLQSAIPDSLAAVVRKAMAFEREARYRSVADLQADIEAYQNGFATGAENAGKWKRFTLFVRRNKAASIGVAAVLVLSIGFMAKVIAEGRRAERALGSLRKAAPSLAAQAQALVAEQKLDDAVEKLDFAIAIAPDNLDYALRRANYLQAALHLRTAADAYLSILRRGPNAEAAASLALCEKLIAAHGDGPLPDSALDELRTALVAQHREAEAMPLAIRLGKGKEAMVVVLRERLAAWQKLPGWRDDRIRVDESGKIRTNLDSLPIADLNPLRGLYVESLGIARNKITDLRPLGGMRLREFSAENMTELRSLEGLEGAPLETVAIGRTGVSDLSPLFGSPLRVLRIGGTLVTDLSPIRNCPLEQLHAGQTAIRSIEALRGKMLRQVYLDSCPNLTDISPLKECPTIEDLLLPPHAENIEFLRSMPRLRNLSYSYGAAETPAEFWKKYDAKQAAGKK